MLWTTGPESQATKQTAAQMEAEKADKLLGNDDGI